MTHELERQFGCAISKIQLLELVKGKSALKHIHVTRAAQRQKKGLICWLCQYCPEILTASTGSLPDEEPLADFNWEEDDDGEISPW
jgi:hypothetical protein